MIQETSNKGWQAEARTQETKSFIRQVKRITRRKFTSEAKIRIVLDGFRREVPIRELCRREGIRPNVYYAWLNDYYIKSQYPPYIGLAITFCQTTIRGLI